MRFSISSSLISIKSILLSKKSSSSNVKFKSKLDDIPGVGEKKKQELLKHFGSVENIKKADIEELTKIKGINPDLARNIKEFLD